MMDGAIGTIVVHDIWSQVIILISLFFVNYNFNISWYISKGHRKPHTTHYNLQEEKAAHSVAC
jgi:hypothetical protein